MKNRIATDRKAEAQFRNGWSPWLTTPGQDMEPSAGGRERPATSCPGIQEWSSSLEPEAEALIGPQAKGPWCLWSDGPKDGRV